MNTAATSAAEEVLSKYGRYRHWWKVLPAIPASPAARDWWAKPDDGRASRYRRLRRCWFDRTWFGQPQHDPERPHAFSNPRCGTSVLCRRWEMFTLWHPAEFVPPLLALSGRPPDPDVLDCCWSYEFKDKRTGKLVDLVMYVRPREGADILVVFEAKYGKDKLKARPKFGLPDWFPGAYLDLDSFEKEPRRVIV